jgi:hypothetical protein
MQCEDRSGRRHMQGIVAPGPCSALKKIWLHRAIQFLLSNTLLGGLWLYGEFNSLELSSNFEYAEWLMRFLSLNSRVFFEFSA